MQDCSAILMIDMGALASVEDGREKTKQNLRAHPSNKDIVIIGVEKTPKAHQSDRKSHRLEEKIGG